MKKQGDDFHNATDSRNQQGQYQQAEGLATRSNSWAGEDKLLRAENWRLIGEARLRRGDHQGAQAAFDSIEAMSAIVRAAATRAFGLAVSSPSTLAVMGRSCSAIR